MELASGEKEGKHMKEKTKYTEGEIEEFEIIEDFLPGPELLFKKEENVKVTLNLSRKSLKFYKTIAKKKKLPYQRLIRRVVDKYAENHN